MELTYGGDSNQNSIESNADMRVFYRRHQAGGKKGMRINVSVYEASESDEGLLRLLERIAEPEQVDAANVLPSHNQS